MKQELMTEVMQLMLPHLDNAQMKKLKNVMEQILCRYEVSGTEIKPEKDDSNELIVMFIAAKRIEGCSEKTLKYYKTTIDAMVTSLGKNVRQILTEDIRIYLTDYQNKNQTSRVTIDNIRRILSSFFSWLEDEDYIIKSQCAVSIRLRQQVALRKHTPMRIWKRCATIVENCEIWQ